MAPVAYTNGDIDYRQLLGISHILTPTHNSAALPDAGQRPDLKWWYQQAATRSVRGRC